MNLRQLETFVAVMKSGSISRAAQMLHLLQPAVSKSIAELEHALGFRLFVRTRGAALGVTPEAEAFSFEVERSFVGIEALKRAARDIRNMTSGNLRIAALPALGVSFLPSVIREFQNAHSGVLVQLQTRSSATVRQWIANQQFEIGLATRAREMPGIDMAPFMRCAGACVLPPGHRLAERDVITARDLDGEDFISLAAEDPTRRRVDRAFEAAGSEPRIVVETQYAMTICALVLQGVGVSILNPVTADDHVQHGLVVRPFEPRIEFEYMLFTPSLRPTSQVAQRFLEFMVAKRERMIEAGLVVALS
ncbi:LysR family transcriptional regulator [Sphingomonas adhaesiva]|uniref:LysR family transcriptional regulator n=1 Tax=Sphingomonas adhaesiva TaxID=28212 RepID=UPI000831EBF7|nr:LysR family transcriptional regulator [Sphingomonas adhaesiva]